MKGMPTQLLEKMGLTRGEIRVYTALIESGSTTAGPLIIKTGMQGSAVYFCLDSLAKKGLIGYAIKNNRKHFEANKPQSLFDFLGERKRDIEAQEKELKASVPLLFAKKSAGEKRQEAKIYEGWDGILNAFFDILEPMKAGDEAYSFSPTTGYGGAEPERVRRLIRKVRLERARRRVRLKIVISKNLKETLGKDMENTAHTSVRYLPEERVNPAVVHAYGDNVLIVLWTETPVAFLIKSRGVAESFKNYFKLLWAQAGA
jgi:sugar-specific transcriptional regulator TrmB